MRSVWIKQSPPLYWNEGRNLRDTYLDKQPKLVKCESVKIDSCFRKLNPEKKNFTELSRSSSVDIVCSVFLTFMEQIPFADEDSEIQLKALGRNC